MGQGRIKDTLLLLRDGNYFDSLLSERATIQMLTYSVEGRSFGLFTGSFEWKGAGRIEFTFSFVGLPALSSLSWDDSFSFPAAYLCLVCLYAAFSIYFHLNSWHIEKMSRWTITGEAKTEHDIDSTRERALGGLKRRNRKKLSLLEKREQQRLLSYNHLTWKPATGIFDVVLEALIVSLMVASFFVYFQYASQIQQQSEVFRSKYDVYDADSSAPCRYHLLQRSRSNASNSALYPGQPGSWALPLNSSGLDGMAGMMTQASTLNNLCSDFTFLVGLIITLLLFNLIRLVGFQPRLGVIPASLHLMAEDVFHLTIVLLMIALPTAVLVVCLLGPLSEQASSFSNSFVGVITMFV